MEGTRASNQVIAFPIEEEQTQDLGTEQGPDIRPRSSQDCLRLVGAPVCVCVFSVSSQQPVLVTLRGCAPYVAI